MKFKAKYPLLVIPGCILAAALGMAIAAEHAAIADAPMHPMVMPAAPSGAAGQHQRRGDPQLRLRPEGDRCCAWGDGDLDQSGQRAPFRRHGRPEFPLSTYGYWRAFLAHLCGARAISLFLWFPSADDGPGDRPRVNGSEE